MSGTRSNLKSFENLESLMHGKSAKQLPVPRKLDATFPISEEGYAISALGVSAMGLSGL